MLVYLAKDLADGGSPERKQAVLVVPALSTFSAVSTVSAACRRWVICKRNSSIVVLTVRLDLINPGN